MGDLKSPMAPKGKTASTLIYWLSGVCRDALDYVGSANYPEREAEARKHVLVAFKIVRDRLAKDGKKPRLKKVVMMKFNFEVDFEDFLDSDMSEVLQSMNGIGSAKLESLETTNVPIGD